MCVVAVLRRGIWQVCIFSTCLVDLLFPKVGMAMVEVLERLGCETVLPETPQVLLREHYRCHPRIINFCNERFYGGKLIVMTEDHGETDVISVVKTVPGDYCRSFYNQRQIDVIKKEILPGLDDEIKSDMGIIAPYNRQVDEIRLQIPEAETATVHKFQGREKITCSDLISPH